MVKMPGMDESNGPSILSVNSLACTFSDQFRVSATDCAMIGAKSMISPILMPAAACLRVIFFNPKRSKDSLNDRLDSHPIAGVVFDILQNGRVVTTMTTDADGVAVSEPIPKGKYTVKEHANPKGYTNDLYCVECEVFSDVTTSMKMND